MSNNFEQVLSAAQQTVEHILKNTSVESFGIMNQTLFIDFRDEYGVDSRLTINALIVLNYYAKLEIFDEIEYALLCMKKVNLLTVERIECTQNQELFLYFAENIVLEILPDKKNFDEDHWQLNNHLHVSDGGKSVIALIGSGYAIW